MAALQTVTEQDFEQEVLMSEVPVLLEFGAEWCGPCKTVAPELEAVAQDLGGKAKVVTVDIDKSPVLAQQMGVQSVPTFVVFHQGRPIDGKVGALRRKQLREMLEPVLPRAQGALKPNELAALIQQGRVTPVDTREAAVFARVRLPGAVNMPLDGIEGRLAELHMLPSPAVLYCRTGEQTKEMAEKLSHSGVPVAFLEGGILGWEAEGLDVERPD
jgi:thioredoxin